MVKDISAIVVAVIVGLLVSVIGMMIYTNLYPYPIDVNPSDKVSMTGFLNHLPNKAYAIKILINIISAFSATLLATLISQQKKRFGFLSLLIFIGIIIFRDSKYDYPELYFVVGLSLTIISGLFGSYLGSRNIK